MPPDAKKLARAKELERAGQPEQAAALFREAGAFEDQARVLAAGLKFKEAAAALAASLGTPLSRLGQLDPAGKKRALLMAIYLGKAGEARQAAEVFVALGERVRAAELLRKAGDAELAARVEAGEALTSSSLLGSRAVGEGDSSVAAARLEAAGRADLALEMWIRLRRLTDAGRVAQAMGKLPEAARLYAEAGAPFEAAQCLAGLGEPGQALQSLVRVPRQDPRYRQAAIQAIGLAAQGGSFDLALEHFLTGLVREGPGSAAELEAFLRLSDLYERHGLPDSAREVCQKVLERMPGQPEALRRLSQLRTPDAGAIANNVAGDVSLRRSASLSPVLSDLELPDLAMPEPMAPSAQKTAAVAPSASSSSVQTAGAWAPPRSLPQPSAPRAPPSAVSTSHPEGTLVRSAGAASLGGATPVVAADGTLVRGPSARTEEVAGALLDALGPGVVLAARYRLEQQIGQGGMAKVFRAYDQELEEEVALKVFTLVQSDPDGARFKQELKLSRQLVHPNIVRLYDIGLFQGARYISMELLRGESLKSRMARPLTIAEGLAYLVQACEGLQAAHDRGIVHRDIKPDNLFVTDEGAIKVMDFGIAKQFEAKGITVAGSIAGTPAYMSPEQVSNFSAVTAVTDLYALGVIAYEMFTGGPLFAHRELVPMLMAHINERPVPPRQKNPQIPQELEDAMLKLLDKDPARRYASCAECAQVLGAIRARLLSGA